MKLFRYLFFFFIFKSILVASTGTAIPETQFTSGVNNRTSCEIECPPFKTGFFGRINKFSYETGETVCNVYNVQNPTKILATVVNKNPHCSSSLVNPNPTTTIDSNTSSVNSHLSSVKSTVSTGYGVSGSTYLNLPKYMVAGLMADDNIIDIPTSIASNEVVLNSSYTILPNIATSSSIIDGTLLSRVKGALSNSITFVINFLSSSNKILLSFQVALFLFSVAMSLILMFTLKGTKKISQVGDHEDMAEKVLFGVVSILIFFLPLNKIATPTGDISQTGYQQLIRPLLYFGVDTADKLSLEATSAYMKYKFSDVGVVSTEELRSFENQKFILEQKNATYSQILPNWCASTYNTAELKTQTSLLGFNLTYPPSEDIYTKGYGNDEKRAVTFYTKQFLNDESYLYRNNIPTVSFCYFIERSILENNTLISDLNLKINAYKNSTPEIEQKLNKLTDLIFLNATEFGFVSSTSLPTLAIAFSHLDVIKKDEALENRNNIENTLKDYRQATGYDVGSVAENDGFLDEALYGLISESAYLMFPFASSIANHIDKKFEGLQDKLSADNLLGSSKIGMFLSNTPVGGFVKRIYDTTLGLGLVYLKWSLTIFIIHSLVLLAPLIAILTASFLVMSFYFLSIFMLYILIPFASIFAFSTGNLEIIKNLVKQTFILSVKPVLIVVSILMALFVYEMFVSFNEVVASSMFESLFYLANNMSPDSVPILGSVTGWLKGAGLGLIFVFLKGLLLVVSSVVSVFACFYLTFNGANVILDILGIRENGFDVGGIIGEKTNEKNINQKMSTLGA